MPDLIVHPLGISVLREYLLSVPEVTVIVGIQVATVMPDVPITEFDPARFPALRIVEITSNEVAARRLVRMLVQIDVWASRQTEADYLARVVIGALRESANYLSLDGTAVLGESTDLSTRSEPDSSVNPVQPRAIVSAQIILRPNP